MCDFWIHYQNSIHMCNAQALPYSSFHFTLFCLLSFLSSLPIASSSENLRKALLSCAVTMCKFRYNLTISLLQESNLTRVWQFSVIYTHTVNIIFSCIIPFFFASVAFSSKAIDTPQLNFSFVSFDENISFSFLFCVTRQEELTLCCQVLWFDFLRTAPPPASLLVISFYFLSSNEEFNLSLTLLASCNKLRNPYKSAFLISRWQSMYDLKELGQANKFCHRTWEPSVLDGGFCVGTAVVVRLLIANFGASGKDERRWGFHVDWVLRGKPAWSHSGQQMGLMGWIRAF